MKGFAQIERNPSLHSKTLDSVLFVSEFVPPQMDVWVGMKVKQETIMTAEISLESLRKMEEEIDFR